MRTWLVGHWELSSATAWLPKRPDQGRVLLLESEGWLRAMPHHRKKVVLVLSALRHLAEALRAKGYEVDCRRSASFREGVEAHVEEFAPDEVVTQEPSEWPVSRSLESLPVRFLPDRRFLTSRADFADWAEQRSTLRMEDFYRWQRKRLGLLMDKKGEPAGGQWNYDRENRQTARALQRRGVPPPPAGFDPDDITRQVMDEVAARDGLWGSVEGFDLPVTRRQALAALDDFLKHRLEDFGPYEDAMLRGEAHLYHSRLSPAMNVGLLHPREILRRAIDHGAPLPSLEGFVRQIAGWREYVNGIYWREMPDYRERNYFEFERALPLGYWEPEALDLACVADSVATVREHGYAHHIHRLMVLCNFAVLAGIHPLRVSEWFWAGFADAHEWVELPNVVGMATFADGGLLASKPYVSAAAYINRMSDYCGGCRYDPKARTGERACPFNYLYWTFLDDIRRRKLPVGQRMALPLRQLGRIAPAQLKAMRAARERFLRALETDDGAYAFDHTLGEPLPA